MKRWCTGIATALCAAGAGAGVPDLVPPAPAAAPVVRPGTFAAASAMFAKPLAPEQREERRFLKDAAAASRFEHDAARMALAKSSDSRVRSLAATLVNHHAGALDTVQRMLQARNMAPPMLANEQRRVLTHLAKTGGAKFDREWMEAVALRSQQDTIAVF
jgi:predicted outer membrane protein